jgi:DNA-binding XRE family transcriptional regulator
MSLASHLVMSIQGPVYFPDIDDFLSRVAKERIETREARPLNGDSQKAFTRKIWELLSDPNRPGDSNAVQFRIELLRYLEKRLRKEFRSTKEAKEEMERHLEGYDGRRLPVALAIRRAREKSKWTQRQLAHHLGLRDHTLISKYEKGERSPSERVLQWLKEGEM